MRSIISVIGQALYPLRKKINKLLKTGKVISGNQGTVKGKNIYDFRIPGIDGNEIDFSTFKGKKILLVNTASECGFTPQYASLQNLYERYAGALVVVGFPSNNFGAQEPGNEDEIAAFCRQNYSVTFPLTKKIDVTGPNQHELFTWLTRKELNGWNDREPNWNFCKYLVDESGMLIHFFSHKLDPLDERIISKIEDRSSTASSWN